MQPWRPESCHNQEHPRRDGGEALEDHDLIARVLRGDPGAERALYEAQVDRVFGLAFRMTGDQSLAEDFTQDVFIRAFDRLETFRGESKLSTWLHSITMSVVLNGLRKRKRIRESELSVEDTTPFDPGVAPAEVDLKLRIRKAIDALSEGMRAVFVLHDVEGFKHTEIAELLDVPVGTSKARLNRARTRLRENLAAPSQALARGEGQ